MGILDDWKLMPAELDTIVSANPSLRGFMFGYVAEYKLRTLWFNDERIVDLIKYANHDRTRKGDLNFFYKGVDISVEVKSLQTATVRKVDDKYTARFQCDASDRRTVRLPSGETLATTCLMAGEFDLLAVNLFAITGDWTFAFARNKDLPRSQHRAYTSEQRQYLLATLMSITWPLTPPFSLEPFALLDQIVAEGQRDFGGPASIGRTGVGFQQAYYLLSAMSPIEAGRILASPIDLREFIQSHRLDLTDDDIRELKSIFRA